MARGPVMQDWLGVLTRCRVIQRSDGPFIFEAQLDREPARKIRLRLTNKSLARIIAKSLLLWADGEPDTKINEED